MNRFWIKIRDGLNWFSQNRKPTNFHFWSTFAVASSNPRIRFCLRMARAKQISCLCPEGKFDPPYVMFESEPADNSFIVSLSFAPSNKFQRASSLYYPKKIQVLPYREARKQNRIRRGDGYILDRKSCSPAHLIEIVQQSARIYESQFYQQCRSVKC